MASRLSARHIEAFRRVGEQHGQRIARFAFLFLEGGNLRLLSGHLRLLLRQIEARGHAVRHLGFGDVQNAVGRVDIVHGDGDALAQRQNVEIGVGRIGGNGERHGLLREARRFQASVAARRLSRAWPQKSS